MRNMTDVVVDDVQAMTSAPVFRAPEFASTCRLVSGQECFGLATAAWQVESASGAVLAGAARYLGLIALGEGLLARHGYVGRLGQERPRPASQPGGGISDSGIHSDNDSSKGANGTKPMNPWDFRTSSPPG